MQNSRFVTHCELVNALAGTVKSVNYFLKYTRALEMMIQNCYRANQLRVT